MTFRPNWFVDRKKQYDRFLKMVHEGHPKRLMLVEAPSNLGKTWLVKKMNTYCRESDITVCYIDFRDIDPNDFPEDPYGYRQLVDSARRQFGPEHFPRLEGLLAGAQPLLGLPAAGDGGGTGAAISDVQDADIKVEVGGDVVGGNKQVLIFNDSDLLRRQVEQSRETAINEAFFDDLRELLTGRVALFLFDSFELATQEAARWIRQRLLPQMDVEGFEQMLVIVAGQSVPQPFAHLEPLFSRTGLDAFALADIEEFIERAQLADVDAESFFNEHRGAPVALGRLADRAVPLDDDW